MGEEMRRRRCSDPEQRRREEGFEGSGVRGEEGNSRIRKSGEDKSFDVAALPPS